MVTLSPATATHLEFASNSQTVSLANTDTDQYQITNVTYKHETGVIFADLKPAFNSNSFSYTSTFDNAVNRVVHFNVMEEVEPEQDQDDLDAEDDQESSEKLPTDFSQKKMVKKTVNNFTLLPEQYVSIFEVENPQESTTITFTISYNQRHKTETTDPTTGSVSSKWSDWAPAGSTSFVATIETNMTQHIALVQQYVAGSQYARP